MPPPFANLPGHVIQASLRSEEEAARAKLRALDVSLGKARRELEAATQAKAHSKSAAALHERSLAQAAKRIADLAAKAAAADDDEASLAACVAQLKEGVGLADDQAQAARAMAEARARLAACQAQHRKLLQEHQTATAQVLLAQQEAAQQAALTQAEADLQRHTGLHQAAEARASAMEPRCEEQRVAHDELSKQHVDSLVGVSRRCSCRESFGDASAVQRATSQLVLFSRKASAGKTKFGFHVLP